MTLVTVDLSYLSVADAVPQLGPLDIARSAGLIALVKPTFELRRAHLAAAPDDVLQAVRRAVQGIAEAGWSPQGWCHALRLASGAPVKPSSMLTGVRRCRRLGVDDERSSASSRPRRGRRTTADGRRQWLMGLPRIVTRIAGRWRLTAGALFQPGGQTAWVAPAHAPGIGAVVLKVAWRHPKALHEAEGAGLGQRSGGRLHRSDVVDHQTSVLLVERCEPGTPLMARPELNQDVVGARDGRPGVLDLSRVPGPLAASTTDRRLFVRHLCSGLDRQIVRPQPKEGHRRCPMAATHWGDRVDASDRVACRYRFRSGGARRRGRERSAMRLVRRSACGRRRCRRARTMHRCGRA